MLRSHLIFHSAILRRGLAEIHAEGAHIHDVHHVVAVDIGEGVGNIRADFTEVCPEGTHIHDVDHVVAVHIALHGGDGGQGDVAVFRGDVLHGVGQGAGDLDDHIKVLFPGGEGEAAVGVHAHEAEEATEEDLQKIAELYSNEKVVAVGEIGLDYHYDFSPRERQIEVFERQIQLAKELDLPIIVHDREAHEDTMKLLKKYKPKGVVHCFSGSAESAKEIVKLGMYIGIGGAVTFKNAKKPVEVVEYLPLDRLLLETDAPYMTPVPFRGTRCDSAHIAYTAEKIAQIKGVDVQELIDICNANAKRLFEI